MKNVLMVLFFATSFAITSADAQTCTPKPECAMAPCASACKGGTAAVNVAPVGVAALATFSPEAISANCGAEKTAGKDGKACQAKCTGTSAAIAPLGTQVNGLPTCTPSPATDVKLVSLSSPAPACSPKAEKQ